MIHIYNVMFIEDSFWLTLQIINFTCWKVCRQSNAQILKASVSSLDTVCMHESANKFYTSFVTKSKYILILFVISIAYVLINSSCQWNLKVMGLCLTVKLISIKESNRESGEQILATRLLKQWHGPTDTILRSQLTKSHDFTTTALSRMCLRTTIYSTLTLLFIISMVKSHFFCSILGPNVRRKR